MLGGAGPLLSETTGGNVRGGAFPFWGGVSNMVGQGSTRADVRAIAATDSPDTIPDQTCHQPPAWVEFLTLSRRWWPNKTAEHISARTGHSIRTVRRWMCGQTTPGIDVGFDLLRSDRGPAVLLLILQDLPPAKRAAHFEAIAKVSRRAALQARLDALKD